MPPDGPCCSVKERPRQRRLLQQQRLVLVQEGHRHGIIKYRQDDHSAMNASGVMPSTRPAAQTFRDLLVWQKAHQFVLGVYQLTATFPRQETFGLALQMRRAAVSIAANIAEGFAKRSQAEKARFLNIAEGSLEESRYYLILTEDLGYSKTEELLKLLEEVSRLLNRYTGAILASGS